MMRIRLNLSRGEYDGEYESENLRCKTVESRGKETLTIQSTLRDIERSNNEKHWSKDINKRELQGVRQKRKAKENKRLGGRASKLNGGL